MNRHKLFRWTQGNYSHWLLNRSAEVKLSNFRIKNASMENQMQSFDRDQIKSNNFNKNVVHLF